MPIRYHKDIGLWLFGAIAVACVVASAPATALQVARFHDSRTWPGLLAVVALVLLLEVGTIASKLARLAVPQAGILLEAFCILGLAVNAASNYAQAVLAASSSSAGIWLYLGAIAYGAFPPVLAYAMLRLFVRRAQTLRGDAQDAYQQAQYALAPIAHVAMVHAELRRLLPDLSIHVPLLPAGIQEAVPTQDTERARQGHVLQARPPLHKSFRAVRSNEGYVYILQVEGQPYYKIGCATNPLVRMRELQCASPRPMMLIHTIRAENMCKLERQFHLHYQDKRVQGEWFSLSQRDINALRAIEEIISVEMIDVIMETLAAASDTNEDAIVEPDKALLTDNAETIESNGIPLAARIRDLAQGQVQQGTLPEKVNTRLIADELRTDIAYVQQVVSRWRASCKQVAGKDGEQSGSD